MLIQLNNIDFLINGKTILSDITWQLCQDEHWAFLGGNGAGKSTFLKLIRGDIWPVHGSTGKRIYSFDKDKQSSPIGIKEKIALVSAESHDVYKKYNCFLNGEKVIQTGFFDSVWLQQKPNETQLNISEKIINQMKLNDLRKKDFREMSQGESRKILIARALVSNPRILILDEFCNGLDKKSRNNLFGSVETIVNNGIQIIQATHRLDEIIKPISHVLLLKDGKIIEKGERDSVLVEENIRKALNPQAKVDGKVFPKIYNEAKQAHNTGKALKYLVQIEKVDVYLNKKKVLESIDWQMNEGENWAVLGDNGAGKSTFLKLISGEVVPAFGGKVNWFGINTRESIWNVKKRISYISAEFQANYSHNLKGKNVVMSGFFSSIGLWDNVTNAQKRIAMDWITFFGIENLAEKDIYTMSYGQFRKILIARAMVNNPLILILDEPCDGLDIPSRDNFFQTIEKLVQTKTNIIFATHHLNELIPQLNYILILKNGKIVKSGKRDGILNKIHY